LAGVPGGNRPATAQLQTLDRDVPVSLFTVSREVDHGSEDMVRRVYAHQVVFAPFAAGSWALWR
jgi:hypothetical protein